MRSKQNNILLLSILIVISPGCSIPTSVEINTGMTLDDGRQSKVASNPKVMADVSVYQNWHVTKSTVIQAGVCHASNTGEYDYMSKDGFNGPRIGIRSTFLKRGF